MDNLRDWLKSGDVERRRATRDEIARLLAGADCCIHDAAVPGVSRDGRFKNAYEAALNLATIVVRASGHRIRSSSAGHHYRTIALLPDLLGEEHRRRANYLNKCREQRNDVMYRDVGKTSEKEVAELLDEVMHFRNDVVAWLEENHPELL